MKFTTFEQVEQAFKDKSGGRNRIPSLKGEFPDVRLQTIQEHKESVEYLLNTEYNTVSGFTFGELMDAMSVVETYTPEQYLEDNKANRGIISESFYGTTQAQAPFPILNKGLVLYMYEKSVLPYLAHVFDLKGNRGLAYYMKLVAQNSVGGVNQGDLIASTRELAKQTTNFVGTHVTNLAVEQTIQGQKTYQFTIPNAPILPQSLVITVDTMAGYLQDYSSDISGITSLTSVKNDFGDVQVDLNTGICNFTFAVAPTQSGLNINATYNRDVQTSAGAQNNMATVAPILDSVQLEAEDFSVFTETNLQQQRLAQIIWGTDWNEEIDSMLGKVYNKEIANRVVADIRSQIPTASTTTYDITPNQNTGDNRLFNTKYFSVVLTRLQTMITKASGINGLGKLTTFIINIDLVPVMCALEKFTQVDAGEDFMSGMAVVGTYDGIPVIGTPDGSIVAVGEILGIYKSKKQAFLTPAVFGTFILPVIRDVYDQNNLSINRKQLIASAAEKVVCPTLSSKITVTGLNSIGLL